MKLVLVLGFVLMLYGNTSAQDPAKTDSDKYKVVLENERVRVLEYFSRRSRR